MREIMVPCSVSFSRSSTAATSPAARRPGGGGGGWVDGVEVRGRFIRRLAGGEKGDGRHGGGNARFEQTDGLLRNLFNRRRFCALLARDRHVGFQDHAFQRDALDPQFLE